MRLRLCLEEKVNNERNKSHDQIRLVFPSPPRDENDTPQIDPNLPHGRLSKEKKVLKKTKKNENIGRVQGNKERNIDVHPRPLATLPSPPIPPSPFRNLHTLP